MTRIACRKRKRNDRLCGRIATRRNKTWRSARRSCWGRHLKTRTRLTSECRWYETRYVYGYPECEEDEVNLLGEGAPTTVLGVSKHSLPRDNVRVCDNHLRPRWLETLPSEQLAADPGDEAGGIHCQEHKGGKHCQLSQWGHQVRELHQRATQEKKV